jgi:hypothetical protein
LLADVFESFGRSQVLEGLIDPRGKTELQLHSEIIEHLGRLIRTDRVRQIPWSTDQRPSLIRQARAFASRGQTQFALVFYATWLEHWANHIIDVLARRRRLADEVIVEIIRESSFRAKFGWLLHVLGHIRINEENFRKILLIGELRNAFVHYKWKGVVLGSEEERTQQKRVRDSLADCERLVRYLMDLERRHLFRGRKRLVPSYRRFLDDQFRADPNWFLDGLLDKIREKLRPSGAVHQPATPEGSSHARVRKP